MVKLNEGRVHVLLIAPACDGLDVGEAWVAFQWAKLLSVKYSVTLLTTFKRGHKPPSEQLSGTRVIEWSEPPLVGKMERMNSQLQPAYASFYLRARRWIRNRLTDGEQFDVAHQVVPMAMRYPSPAVGLGIPLILGPVGGSLESPPAFLDEEGATPWWQRLRRLDSWRLRHDPLMRRTYELADCVIGVAPYVRDRLQGVTLKRFEIMSEIALHDVEPVVDRSERTGAARLLYVGRIVRTKGLRDVIRALDKVRQLNIFLDVVGDGNDRANCEALVRELGIADRVKFHGAIARSAVDSFYEAADVFVFPSYREAGGAVPLEAMAQGLPLIVCAQGGPGANVSEACAIKLEAISPTQLSEDCADAIQRVVEDRGLRLRMGEAARKHVEETHLWRNRVARMGALYDEICTQKSPKM